MEDFNDNFENDCLTELGNREAWDEAWEESHDHDESDCGDENDIEQEDTQ